MKKIDVRRLVIVSAFAAISAVLYCFVKFPITALFPSFLEFNFSMLPILIILFMFGPVDAILMVIIRFVIKIIVNGTGTAYVGELADIGIALITILAVFLAKVLFKNKEYKESKKTIIYLSFAILGWVLGSMILNWLVLVPAYKEQFFDGNIEPLVGCCKVIPGINKSNFMPLYIFAGVLPFNLSLSLVVSIVTYIVHMRTYKIFESVSFENDENKESVSIQDEV